MAGIDTSLLKPELVFFDFEATDRVDLFTRLGAILAEKGYVKDTWLAAILEREDNYPTGLACEAVQVALPHVDPEHLLKPYIAIAKPAAPVRFDGMAGSGPVDAQLVVNLGLLAHAEDQVGVLQAFLGIFIDADATKEIMAQTDAQAMIDAVVKYCG